MCQYVYNLPTHASGYRRASNRDFTPALAQRRQCHGESYAGEYPGQPETASRSQVVLNRSSPPSWTRALPPAPTLPSAS
eukprot:683547-Rhodomonas_salina.2